jgi:hypothetical protein
VLNTGFNISFFVRSHDDFGRRKIVIVIYGLRKKTRTEIIQVYVRLVEKSIYFSVRNL